MSNFLLHLTQAFRRLLKRPGFTVAVVLTLALGVGANTAGFSLLDRLILSVVTFPEPTRLVHLNQSDSFNDQGNFSLFAIHELQRANSQFEAIAAYREEAGNMATEGDPVQVVMGRVTGNFFSTLRVTPMLGRDFLSHEDSYGGTKVAILSYTGWQRRFGGNPAIIGKTLLLNGETHQIIGVLRPETRMPPMGPLRYADLFRPAAFSPVERQSQDHSMWTLARLKPGVSREAADQELKGIMDHLATQYPEQQKGVSGRVREFKERILKEMAPQMLMIQGVVLFVMLIACVNVASLMLANGLGRQREMATRISLGAARSQLMAQLLTESAILGCLGFLAALAFGKLLMMGFPALLPVQHLQIVSLQMDGRALLFCLASAIGAVLIFGLLPAWKVSRVDPASALKAGGKGSAGGHQRLRRALVIFEVALASSLLICASLLLRSLGKLGDGSPGFETRPLLTAQYRLVSSQFPTPEAAQAFAERVVQKVAAMPGVEAVGLTSILPTLGGNRYNYDIQGQAEPEPNQKPSALGRWVSPGYHKAMGIQFLRGKGFSGKEPDNVCVINETFAEKHWPGQDPVGKSISLDGPSGPWLSIVGVTRGTRWAEPADGIIPEFYKPFHHAGRILRGSLALRTQGRPETMIPALRKAIRELDANLPLANVWTGEELLDASYQGTKLIIRITAVFSLMALILAGVGIYGVMSLLVTFRTREIGVRMALGARVWDVLRLVLTDGLSMVSLGLSLGLLGGFGLGNAIRSQLYGVTPTDPTTFVTVSAALALVALFSTLSPALRAATVNPTVALRDE